MEMLLIGLSITFIVLWMIVSDYYAFKRYKNKEDDNEDNT